MSGYPPGVTGNEYEISGPEREWEDDATCPLCGTEGLMLHQSHRQRGMWAFCSNTDCPNATAGFDVDPTEVEEAMLSSYFRDEPDDRG